MFCCIGVYSLQNNVFDIYLAVLFGVLGWIFVKLECEPAPLLLGFILGPLMEENLRRALLLSRGDPTVFVTRPLSGTLLAPSPASCSSSLRCRWSARSARKRSTSRKSRQRDRSHASMTPLDGWLPYPSRRQPLYARNVVATSQPLAAQAGLAMLARGGNAVDAALATAITLTVVEPTTNGIGSDLFAIVWDGEKLAGLNASGRSPSALTPERFAGLERMPTYGWDTVTIPGAVSGWAALSQRYGQLPFADLFEPAIRYARDGFAVAPTIAQLWQRAAKMLPHDLGFGEHFLPRGRAPEAGEIFASEAMARTLETIAESHGNAFYRGALAAAMVDHASRNGGAHTLADFAEHTVDWVTPLAQRYRDVHVHEIPPNGQGIAALMALGMLQHFDLGARSRPTRSKASTFASRR